MTTPRKQPKTPARWFDADDFTPAHDEIMIQVMTGWKNFVKNKIQKQGMKRERIALTGKFYGEPELKGYPPVYPDGIIGYDAVFGHPLDRAELHIEPRDWSKYQSDMEYFVRTISRGFTSVCPPRPPADCYVACKCQLCGEEIYMDELFPCRVEQGTIIIEIKPKVDSFGSVLRQLNIYRDRGDSAKKVASQKTGGRDRLDMVLVTPDHRFDELFEEQGITVADPQEFLPPSTPDEGGP